MIVTPAQLRKLLDYYSEADEIQLSGDDGQRGDVYAYPLPPQPGPFTRACTIASGGRVICTYGEDDA